MNYNNEHTAMIVDKLRQNLIGRGAGLDELFLDLGTPEKKLKHFKQAVQINIHHFYLTEEIREADYYLNMLQVIRTAEQHDTILIHLNTPGGSLYTAIQIMAAMQESQGTIITSLEGQVCSAGTMIFLTGDKSIVHRNTTFMIHNYSQWVGGKGNEITSQVKYTETFFSDLARDVYGNFLSEEEINSVTQGKDFWMNSKEVCRRLGDKLILPEKKPDPNEMLLQALEEIEPEKPPVIAPSETVEAVKPKKPRKKVADKAKP